MKTIAIETAQKVSIEYQLAGLRNRIIGFIIDQFILSLLISLLSYLFFTAMDGLNIYKEELVFLYYFIFVFPLWVTYTAFFEIFNNGRTPGKMAVGTKVVKINGGVPSVTDYLVRWVFRFVEIYTCAGVIGAILVSSSDKGQRLGGMISNTTVITTRLPNHFRLEDIDKIGSKEAYTPQYKSAVNLREEDVLVIKQVLDRSRKQKGETSKKAIEALSNQLKEVLRIDEEIKNHPQFLATVLKDYIVLSR